MMNGSENEYESNNVDKHELSPLLLVPPMDNAKNAQNSCGSKRFVALLLVVDGSHEWFFERRKKSHSSFSSLLGTGRKKGESCASPWYNGCGDKLSCYDSGSNGRYCVPMGQENACCGWDGEEASGIDCDKDLYCDDRSRTSSKSDIYTGTVPTCHLKSLKSQDHAWFAKKGSCNINTGERASNDNLVELKCGYTCFLDPNPPFPPFRT